MIRLTGFSNYYNEFLFRIIEFKKIWETLVYNIVFNMKTYSQLAYFYTQKTVFISAKTIRSLKASAYGMYFSYHFFVHFLPFFIPSTISSTIIFDIQLLNVTGKICVLVLNHWNMLQLINILKTFYIHICSIILVYIYYYY